MDKFIKSIVSNLESNGFPLKKVSLPTVKMFEIADNRGFSLNKVFDQMKTELNIDTEIGDEKIIFFQVKLEENPFGELGSENMIKKAQGLMRDMDPAELKKIQEQFMSMSDEDKADLLARGKDLGLG